MNEEEIQRLYERCTTGAATHEEQKQFEEFHDSFDLSDIPWSSQLGDYDQVKKSIYQDLHHKLSLNRMGTLRIWYWSVAASILLISTAALLYTNTDEQENRNDVQLTNSIVIRPGSDLATLTLADGTKISLDDQSDGVLHTEGNTRVLKDKKELLIYEGGPSLATVNTTLYNTMSTPKGGQYKVQLSDGTKVWLNAATSLKYPVTFTGKERIVELNGEAYFEVAKNKEMPFKVVTSLSTVEVLGTHFNVNAYPDEPLQATTLLEGSVRIHAQHRVASILRPGEQALVDLTGAPKISKVIASDAIDWKDGIFVFKNEDIESVLRKIARWYDIDVEYRGNVRKTKLGGTVSRFNNIQDLLNTIEITESVHFKIEGRKVIVMP